jgi:hypothetical protein
MNNIPPELRAKLGPYVWGVSKENGQAFIDMLRRTMPMEEYVDILRNNSLTERNFGFEIGDDPENARKTLRVSASPRKSAPPCWRSSSRNSRSIVR